MLVILPVVLVALVSEILEMVELGDELALDMVEDSPVTVKFDEDPAANVQLAEGVAVVVELYP